MGRASGESSSASGQRCSPSVACYSGAPVLLGGPNPAASYLTTLHVLHVEAVLALLALLVLLLLAAALLDDAEAAGQDQHGCHHRDGDDGPGRHWGRTDGRTDGQSKTQTNKQTNKQTKEMCISCIFHTKRHATKV